jgi:diguanylate cyclase (GGDEF)-like protein
MVRDRRERSATKLFGLYAALILIPVLAIGGLLAASYQSEARRRGLAEGRAEAQLVAHTAVEPLLEGHDLSAGLSSPESAALLRVVENSPKGTILRLRVRDTHGVVVWSADGSGLVSQPDDEAAEAAEGQPVSLLTHLNADRNDKGPKGVAAIENYVALRAGAHHQVVGVLEVYLPYAPIRADAEAGLGDLYRNLAIGLGALYVVLFGITVSVTRRLRHQLAENRFLAEHDTLTGLANRTVFQRVAREAVARATEVDPAAIAIIDLDRFKEVNDSLGHHNGDRLLVELARRLEHACRSGDLVARLGGDEFGVVLQRVDDAHATLTRLRNVIDQELEVDGLPLSVEASIGYVIVPDDGHDVAELLQWADIAMYVAKAEHSGVVRHAADHDGYDPADLALVSELRVAIDAGQLTLHFQPKATLADGRVEAVEALVRWQHPVLGMLGPDRFLPLAEQTDLIDRLTDWVVDRAVIDIQRLGPDHQDLAVAVNVSARNLAQPDFAERVIATLDRHGMDPGRLVVELTETALLSHPDRVASLLAQLARAGIRVSIDDFGKGQTSLGYLSALTVHELKIDQSFVTDMLEDPAHAAIVRSIVDLGHNLALQVVGEGVETYDVLTRLRQTGCDVAQGFLFARPMPVDELRDWLKAPHTEVRADTWTPSMEPYLLDLLQDRPQ